MADALVELVKAIQAGGPNPVIPPPSGQATDAAKPGSGFGTSVFDPLNVGTDDIRPVWFPSVPAEATGNLNSTNPSLPGGALEILSVTQIAGATANARAPCVVRSYQVIGQVV